jgi:hypothetical protein
VAPISTNDIEGVRLLLDAGVDPRRPLPADLFGDQYTGQPPVGAVAEAIGSQCDTDLIALLLATARIPTNQAARTVLPTGSRCGTDGPTSRNCWCATVAWMMPPTPIGCSPRV